MHLKHRLAQVVTTSAGSSVYALAGTGRPALKVQPKVRCLASQAMLTTTQQSKQTSTQQGVSVCEFCGMCWVGARVIH